VLTRRCIGHRFVDTQAVPEAIAAWKSKRNDEQIGAGWQFTTADARIKRRKLYPIPDTVL
jgi:hypothetical protein